MEKDLNRHHRTVRAQVEHALAHMKTFTILRDYRRASHTVHFYYDGVDIFAELWAKLPTTDAGWREFKGM